tara:strand:- start:288 stop:611 length:324 start_codon:yes stop_codon:yes gene_type:complete
MSLDFVSVACDAYGNSTFSSGISTKKIKKIYSKTRIIRSASDDKIYRKEKKNERMSPIPNTEEFLKTNKYHKNYGKQCKKEVWEEEEIEYIEDHNKNQSFFDKCNIL